MKTTEKLSALRAEMKKKKIDIYVIPTDDFHCSEYVGDYFKCREYVSGFTGSAGTLVVGANEAALWTDGRYFIQAASQLEGSTIELMKSGEKGVPKITDYIAEHVPEGGSVGFDGRTVRESFVKQIISACEGKNIKLVSKWDLTDNIWSDRPPLSKESVWEMEMEVCGMGRSEKLERVRAKMKEKGADMLVIAALDEAAWLLNLRGGDVESTPVFLCYMVITPDEATVFADRSIFSNRVKKALSADGIRISAYQGIESHIRKCCKEKRVWADESTVNYRLMNAMGDAAEMIRIPDPVCAMKAVKNETERNGMETAHIRDAVAMIKFLYWFKQHVGLEKITEISAALKLHEFRAEQEGFIEDSFETIMGYASHGAIVHYCATRESDAEIFARGLLLIDSGGHYNCGTTDVTRTVVCGKLTDEEKRAFTLVLKGHLNLENACFKYGCGGEALDVLAREPLWDEGLDYNHGTGHGVGFVLSVHEGPARIHWNAARGGSVAIEEGMVLSDEPGLYMEGRFGIRHENLLLCEKATENEYGQFMKFKPLTLIPIDKKGIDISLMDEKDIKRLDEYHKMVWDVVSPYLEGEEKEWLLEATSALSRSIRKS